MTDVVSEEMRMLITARQWLHVLIEKFDVDPDSTKIEATSVGPDGRRVLAFISLAETLPQIDALTVTVVTRADNDV